MSSRPGLPVLERRALLSLQDSTPKGNPNVPSPGKTSAWARHHRIQNILRTGWGLEAMPGASLKYGTARARQSRLAQASASDGTEQRTYRRNRLVDVERIFHRRWSHHVFHGLCCKSKPPRPTAWGGISARRLRFLFAGLPTRLAAMTWRFPPGKSASFIICPGRTKASQPVSFSAVMLWNRLTGNVVHVAPMPPISPKAKQEIDAASSYWQLRPAPVLR